MAPRIIAVVLVAAAVAVGLAWSWGVAIVLAFCSLVAYGVVVAADVGGSWIAEASRRRFDRDR